MIQGAKMTEESYEQQDLVRRTLNASKPDELREYTDENVEILTNNYIQHLVCTELPGCSGRDFEIACRIVREHPQPLILRSAECLIRRDRAVTYELKRITEEYETKTRQRLSKIFPEYKQGNGLQITFKEDRYEKVLAFVTLPDNDSRRKRAKLEYKRRFKV